MSIEVIQKLRKETGAGIMDVKNALKEADGDEEKARDFLRKRGIAISAKKSERDANDGLVFSYIHPGSKLGVLLHLSCETDFVAQTDEFKKLGMDLAMHIAATDPRFIRIEDVGKEIIIKEVEVYAAQMKNENKPQDVIEKIIEGKLEKFYKESVLMEQNFIKDEEKTIKSYIEEVVLRLGENIFINKFFRAVV